MSAETKCSCQFCNGHIAFDTTMAGQLVACPHCGMETKLFVPNIPLDPPPPPAPTKSQAPTVKGAILDFTVQTNAGIISGDDGQRYVFQGAEWREVGKFPAKGMRVDFSPLSGQATAIYLMHGASKTTSEGGEIRECNRLVAGLLAIFLGCFGIHRFYMGHTQMGILYIVGGVVTCGVGFGVTAVIGIVEGIVYLSMTQDQFEQKYILNQPKALTPKEAIGKVITVPPAKRVLLLVIAFVVLMAFFLLLAKLGR